MNKNKYLINTKILFLFGIIISNSVCATETWIQQNSYSYFQKKKFKQWFTGPVLTPTPITLPPGYSAFEVANLALNTYGFYNDRGKIETQPNVWSVGPSVDFMMGLTERVGIELTGSYQTNFSQGEKFSHLSDIKFRIGLQILNDIEGTNIPDFRVLLQETFPTGKYDNLDPWRKNTDITGSGAFETGLHLALQKLYCNNTIHPYRIRWTIGYFFPHRFRLRGLNIYGGDEDTNGKMQLGNRFTSFFSFEYSLNRKWSLAFEANVQYRWKATFKDLRRASDSSKRSIINKNPFFQCSILPEIEYTFTEKTGMLIGSWFTIAGSSSPAFGGGFISMLHLF